MKVFVTGARGQLGADLCPLLACKKGLTLDCTDREDLDLCDTDAVRQRVLNSRPDVILHAAAYTDVDRAERESDLCRRINLDATVCLAEAAEQIGASFLFLSSDYVFSGEGEEFYRTSSPKLPLNVGAKPCSSSVSKNKPSGTPGDTIARCGVGSCQASSLTDEVIL